ncbi:6828_t:CDS:2 [Cetraspora pellucida]|uniref:6828_t:CDS:1 n=1 Tax=Cetraspora pellucida TaxID=1433469 RepID=A0A9N8VTH0_9GLOM|nr:6828_t:CDS:2 [Cetraspora pellucida]
MKIAESDIFQETVSFDVQASSKMKARESDILQETVFSDIQASSKIEVSESDNVREIVQTFKTSMTECIRVFSDCTQIKTDDLRIKNQLIEKVTNIRLKFRRFAEKSVDYCTKLSGYIVDLKGVIDLVSDEKIHKEDIIEELKSLSDETKDYDAISNDLFKQLMDIDQKLQPSLQFGNNAERQETLIKLLAEYINNKNNLKDEKTGLVKYLLDLTEAFAEIAISLSKFKIWWDKQRMILPKILNKLDNAEKENRINTLKVKLISGHLEILKSSISAISDCNYAILEMLMRDRIKRHMFGNYVISKILINSNVWDVQKWFF